MKDTSHVYLLTSNWLANRWELHTTRTSADKRVKSLGLGSHHGDYKIERVPLWEVTSA